MALFLSPLSLSDRSVIDIIVQFAEGQCLAIHASLRGF